MVNTTEEERVHVKPDVDPRLARAQSGCQESLNALMRAHDGLVKGAARRQVSGSAPFAELLQAGRRYFSQASMRKLHEPEELVNALSSSLRVAPIH